MSRYSYNANLAPKVLKVVSFPEINTNYKHNNNHEYHIRKTCPCNIYPLIPHVYIVKLGYAGVYLFFIFLPQNIDCGYSQSTHNLCFEQK